MVYAYAVCTRHIVSADIYRGGQLERAPRDTRRSAAVLRGAASSLPPVFTVSVNFDVDGGPRLIKMPRDRR